MYSNRLFSPLRYPGGKVRFAPFIREVMVANDLAGGDYCEPYAGGAAVALDLLFSDIASHIHINDLDEAVHSFWQAVTQCPEDLLRLLRDTPVTIDEWHRWRAVLLAGDTSSSMAERGFATLFMNRTNRSGILKAGVIGGKAQGGLYKLDTRFNKVALAERITKIADRATDITIYRRDAAEFLLEVDELLPARSLVYLDPPYFVKGQGLYRNYYDRDDHEQIAGLLQADGFKRSWVVSYDNSPDICNMYSRAEGLRYELFYSAQVKYSGNEVMFFSQGLLVPNADVLPSPTVSIVGG
jgi:DNA adenine methylase